MSNLMDVMSIADRAAAQNDRWLFIALLAVFIFTLGFFWRWILGDRKELAARLTQITDRHIEQSEKLVTVVTNNTMALQQVSAEILHCRERDYREGRGGRPPL